MRHWNLLEIEAPDGTRDPVVLHSDDEARAVLIRIGAGQRLGEHQVKERAWITVVDGTVRMRAGGDEIEAGPGTPSARRDDHEGGAELSALARRSSS